MTVARPIEREEQKQAIRVLVADDEETVVNVLRALIGSDPALRFVGSANDAEDAIELAVRERPDVVLMDVRMPGGGGLRAVREITKRCPPTKIVALSAHEDSDTVISMISAGARAYVPKADSTEKILREIHRSVDSHWAPPETKPAKSSPKVRQSASAAPRRNEQSARVARAIIDWAITAEFEPIVDLETRQVAGLEARPRVATLPHRSYDTWLAEAETSGLLPDIELAAFRTAIRALREVPEDLFLEFEISQSTAASEMFRRALRRPPAARVVLGLTPRALIGEGSLRGDALADLRARGVRISAREVGPGLPGLRHLATLSPEFARLDPTITRSAGCSFAGHAIVAAAVACAEQVGAKVIADGVSSDAQLRELGRLGVRYVQGPLVAAPVHQSELRADPNAWSLSAVKPRGASADDMNGEVSPKSISTPGADAT